MKADRVEFGASGPDSTAIDGSPERQENRWKGWLREVVETVLLAVVIWLAVNFATARFVVEGGSMEPNLHTGEFVIVSRLVYMFGEPERGDVVVFRPPTNPDEDYIKRVIGLPGDTVEVREGQVYVNDQQLQEPYIGEPTPRSGVWVVREGEYFVMGDNRTDSDDSRNWGTLDAQLIIGKAWLIYWPPHEWGLVPHQVVTAIPVPQMDVAAPTATVVPPALPVVGGESVAPPVVEPTVEQPPPTPAPSPDLVGSAIVVVGTEGIGLAVREQAGVTYGARFVAQEGERYVVEAGPLEQDGYTWWYIVDPDNPENYGWAVENYMDRALDTGLAEPALSHKA